MDNCCAPEAYKSIKLTNGELMTAGQTLSKCPVCGQTGKHVGVETVRSLIMVSPRLVEEAQYYFCRAKICPVVYFDASGDHTFTTNQLREIVFQKEPDALATKVCYCFDHRVGEIQNASPDEQEIIIDDINAGISAGQCACDLRNPQGTCCLGNVLKLVHL